MKVAKEKLKKLGEKVLDDIESGKNPSIDIPLRTLSNVVYDPKTCSLTLGKKSAKRFLFNIAHAKKFTQTTMVAAFCNQLLKEGLHTSLRDMFYALKRTFPNSDENTFEEENQSNSVLVDLEVTLNTLREQLNLAADVRGKMVGRILIKDRGDTINCSRMGSGGWGIPSVVEDIQFKKIDANFILVVEKNALYERLNEDKFWQKYKAILITVQGQAARGARRLIQRLSLEQKLPVYVVTDANSWGWYIYSVIKYGSISLAHVSDRLGTPTAKFLGMTISDIERFGLQNFTERATEVDIKRAQEMLKYEWFKHPAWQKELKLLIQKKIKAEIEALSGRGLRFVTETYLPTKIENQEFLP
ncbi:MAG: DNA topoisomerase IV subunit A [Candidatus Aenigmarchaeota archaeon]|nr:DNA topoisomerase IV subunit A [Candidatus Aenigmarchaeota archaeon]